MKNLVLAMAAYVICFNLSAQSSITLHNSSKDSRMDEAFVVKRTEMNKAKGRALPALKNSKGEWIPAQIDDLTGDGHWDELAFVYSLQPKETVNLKIEWVKPSDYPQFKSRTNVRLGKMFAPGDIRILDTDILPKINLPRGKGYPYQTDGPAWENDKVGFRHYFDGRNVRDVFGKRTAEMVMDTVGIRPDGTPGDTYHVLNSWGRDIMSGARSMGLGGVGVACGDSLIRLGVLLEERINNVDSTRYRKVVNGPIRTIFELHFYGWDVMGNKVDVHETMIIWAGKYGYENRITTSRLPKGAMLMTGIVNNFNNQPYIREEVGDYEIMATHDKQTYDKVWWMGMALLIDRECWVNQLFEAPKMGKRISTSWCTALQPNKTGEYRYYCLAAWELTDRRFTERGFFEQLLRKYANELSKQSTLKLW